MIPGIEGSAVNVRVGNGVGTAVPEAFTDCDGRICGINDGIVNPNCRARGSSAVALVAASNVMTPRSISLESI